MNETTEVHIQVGESASQALPNLSMSGYEWTAENTSEAIEATVVVAPPTERVGGSVGEVRLEVRGLAPGVADLTLRQKRPWETSAYEERKVRVVVA